MRVGARGVAQCYDGRGVLVIGVLHNVMISPGDTQFWRTPEPLFYVIGYCLVEGASANRSTVRQSLGWRPSCNFCQS